MFGRKKRHRVFAFRHAEAIQFDKRTEEVATFRDDVARFLSERGQAQAEMLRDNLASIVFTAVGASPAIRALQTASVVARSRNGLITHLWGLFPPQSKRKGDFADQFDLLYEAKGDSPLRGYHLLAGDEKIMNNLGDAGWKNFRENLLKRASEGDVLVFGHGVLLQATFFAAAVAAKNEECKEALLDIILHTADGFVMEFVGNKPVAFTPLIGYGNERKELPASLRPVSLNPHYEESTEPEEAPGTSEDNAEDDGGSTNDVSASSTDANDGEPPEEAEDSNPLKQPIIVGSEGSEKH